MSFDLVCFASAADKSAGLTAVVQAAGDTHYTGNGVPGTATQIYPKTTSVVFGFCVTSNTAAALQARFHKTSDPEWNSTGIAKIRTTQYRPDDFQRIRYPVDQNTPLECTMQNGGARLDCLSLFVAKGSKNPNITLDPEKASVPMDATWARFTATGTHVANAWSPAFTLVPTAGDIVLNPKSVYRIHGMRAWSATGHAHRLHFQEGPNVNDRPGVPGGNTATPPVQMAFYGDFGEFMGLVPPSLSSICEAADASAICELLISEVRSG